MADIEEYTTGYDGALRAAGATVLAYKEFGSYQGDWLAKVEYAGETFWLRDYFGSCSGCDEIEAEMNYRWDEGSPEYRAKLAEIGKRHLEPQERLTFDEAVAKAAENVEWDSEAEAMVAFVRANA